MGKLYDDAANSLGAAEDDWNELSPNDDLAAALREVEQIFRTENGQWGQLVIQGTPPDPATGLVVRRRHDASLRDAAGDACGFDVVR